MHLRDLIQFLSELEENNNRAWFVMNKPRYDILRAELLELVTGLISDITRTSTVQNHFFCSDHCEWIEEA